MLPIFWEHPGSTRAVQPSLFLQIMLTVSIHSLDASLFAFILYYIKVLSNKKLLANKWSTPVPSKTVHCGDLRSQC